jgi:hypothetical protein
MEGEKFISNKEEGILTLPAVELDGTGVLFLDIIGVADEDGDGSSSLTKGPL